ncbi:MAK10-like protein [Tanacetum coccineum]
MASQDARLSKFEADFKQQQSEMTNKIDIVLKAITDRMAGALPSDTVKNPKLNVNSTSPVSSARSYPIVDPQCSSYPSTSINAVKTCSTKTNHSQKSQLQTGMEIGTQQTKEPKQTLEDEFKDLHLNLSVLKVLAHALMYNAILDKYLESLELGYSEPFDTLADLGACVNIIPLCLFKKLNIGLLEGTDYVFGLADGTKSYPIGIIRDVEVHIRTLKLLTNFYVIDIKKDPETPLLVGRGFLATANAVDYRKVNIAIGEGITGSLFRVKGIKHGTRTPYFARKDFLDCHLPEEWEIARDAEINPFKDVIVFRRMMLIDPDGEKVTKTLQSVPTSRKLSEREDPREIIDLDHFYDTKYFKENEKKIFTGAGDSVRIYPDGVKPMITSSLSSYLYCFYRVNPKVSLYISYPANFTPGVVVFVFDLQVIFDEKKLGSS